MIANRELWKYGKNEKVQICKYRNSHNLLHWHYDCELLYLDKGCLEIFCDKKTYNLTAGQAFFIDSEQLHYMQALVPETVLTVIIFDHGIIEPFSGDKSLESPLLHGDYSIPEIYAALKKELSEKKELYEYKTVCGIEQLMIEIFRNERYADKCKSERSADNFKRLLVDVDEKYRFYTFESGAEFMNMNSAYFSRFFHNMAGMPFSRYLNCVRVEKAVELLRSENYNAVTSVADMCGFNTIRNFNRIFKSFTGYAPSEMPRDFKFDKLIYRNDDSSNPTLLDCVLIESSRQM